MLWCILRSALGRANWLTQDFMLYQRQVAGTLHPPEALLSVSDTSFYCINTTCGDMNSEQAPPGTPPQLLCLLLQSRVMMDGLHMDGCKCVCYYLWYIWIFVFSLLLVSIVEYSPHGQNSPCTFISASTRGVMRAHNPRVLLSASS